MGGSSGTSCEVEGIEGRENPEKLSESRRSRTEGVGNRDIGKQKLEVKGVGLKRSKAATGVINSEASTGRRA